MVGAPGGQISFVLGSCWYPGSWFDHDVSDRLFGKLKQEVTKPDGVDHLLLVGDQIYADASYAIFDIAENRERYQESYRRAFRSPEAAWVLRHVPTHFAIDDHEFRDNYPTPFPGDTPEKIRALGDSGAQEAWNFQMYHGVQPPASAATGTAPARDNRLWYAFESCGFKFFVFDTRSERNFKESGARRVISKTQEDGFRQWVNDLSNYPTDQPLFLVTGSPLVPIPADELSRPARATSSDSLRGYPEFVHMVAGTLSAAGIRRSVVWMSGDPHYSAMGRFIVRDDQGRDLLNCIGIVASGVSVPLPFANDRADAVDWTSTDAVFRPIPPEISILVQNTAWLSLSRAHALRLDVTRAQDNSWTLRIAVIDADGHPPSATPVTMQI